MPLAFIALVRRMVNDRSSKMVALSAGILSVLSNGLPLNIGIIVAILGSTIVGILLRAGDGNFVSS